MAVLGLLVIALPVFGAHALHGGLYRDDWRFWLDYHNARPGLGGAIHAFDWTSFRPLQQLWWPATEAILGPHPVPQTIFTLLLAVAASALLFQLMTMMGAGRPVATAVALLVLLFPASDATRLWPAADVTSAGIALYLLGAITSLGAFRRSGAIALVGHVVAVLLYLASIALYEVALPLIALSVLVYRLRTSWRAAMVRWAVDLAVVVPFVALVTTHSSTLYPRSPLKDVLSHAQTFAGDALSLGSRAFVPFGNPPHLLGVLVLAGAAAIGALGITFSRDRLQRLAVLRWLLLALAGVVLVGIGYAPYLLASVFDPLAGGLHNRINVLPSIGSALIVVATFMVVVTTLVPARWPRAALLRSVVPLGLAAAVAVGYGIRTRQDANRWDQAAALQRQTLNVVVAAIERQRGQRAAASFLRREYVLVFDQYAFTAPGVPVFNESDDLDAALKARLGDHGQTTYPAPLGAFPYCEKGDVWFDTKDVALDDDYGDFEPANYGHVMFVDVRRRRSARIDSGSRCDRALGYYLPGALLPGA